MFSPTNLMEAVSLIAARDEQTSIEDAKDIVRITVIEMQRLIDEGRFMEAEEAWLSGTGLEIDVLI